MIDGFARLLSGLHSQAPGLSGQCHADWGARILGSRSILRRSIGTALPSLSESDQQSLHDLTEPPRPSAWSISISHTLDLGGWMAVPRPAQVGWDVELEARIKSRTVERVCSPDELAAAPKLAFLWCAKEAFYKALEDEQPTVITQLTIADWRSTDDATWRWRGLGPRNAEGLLLRDGDWLMAAAIIP